MLADILNKVKTLTTDWTTAKAAFLDAAISSRAPSSTALSTAVWTAARAGYIDLLNTNLDAPISGIAGGEVSGDTLTEVTYTANNTWTVPTGFAGFVFVTMCGGGGAGGDDYDSGSNDAGGGGGGGGGYCYRWPI